MTKTLTTERMTEIAKLAIRLQQISSCAAVTSSGETVLHHTHVDEILSALHDVTAEILRYREAAETPSCWEIAGQLFTTKEEALKPGYRGTPEPLYDGPVLTDDREAQPVASREHFESLCNQFWNWAEFDEINTEEEPRLKWDGKKYSHRVTAALWRIYQAAPPVPAVEEFGARRCCKDKKCNAPIVGYSVDGLCEDCYMEMSKRPAPVVNPEFTGATAVPDGYCIMPLTLTAANGAKGALSGEFKVSRTVRCHECGGEGCDDCADAGEFEEEITVPWDSIKDIYRAAVDACRAAMLAQPVSQGYKLVPIVPTQEMRDAWFFMEDFDTEWKAMLAAAPEGGN